MKKTLGKLVIPKNFCWKPYTSLYIDKFGFSSPCCGYRDISMFSKQELYNNNAHADIRDSIKNKRFLPDGCLTKCLKPEMQGSLSSDRLGYYGPTDVNLVKENKFSLKVLELAVDNTCNLACTICNNWNSSKWAAENKRMGITENQETRFLDTEIFKDEKIWESVESLILWGGEPFYSKNTTKLINWLVESKISQNIELFFYTNGTIIPDNFIDITENFKKINYSVSIDGTGDRFELMRWPASWETVNLNVLKLKNREFANVNLGIIYTYSLLNASYTVEDFNYFINNYTDNIIYNVLTEPEHYCIKHLPDRLKEKLIKKYEGDAFAKYLIPELLKDRDEEMYKKAIETLVKLDGYRNTDYRILFDDF